MAGLQRGGQLRPQGRAAEQREQAGRGRGGRRGGLRLAFGRIAADRNRHAEYSGESGVK
jgi:hypothetical protein